MMSKSGLRDVDPPGAFAALALSSEDFIHDGAEIPSTQVRRKRDIIVAGEHCETLFINHTGWLFRYKILHNGNRQILDFILPGQVFGLQACLFETSLYSIATITDVSLSMIPLDMIERMAERRPHLVKALFRSATCEAAILGEHLIDASRRSARERIGHLLLELFLRLKAAGLVEGMSFQMPLTQELISDAVGLTTVHVNRTLRSLRDARLIAIEGSNVTILDFEALSRLCGFENGYLGEAVRKHAIGMKPSCRTAADD
jgi:CRP-like cAMP-binding protein